MGYSYVYVGIGIAIVIIGAVVILQLESVQQPTKEAITYGNDKLTKCSDNGTHPFMEGFYLSHAIIYTLKSWNWGDGTPQENNTSIVMNHEYRLLKNETSQKFNGSVIEYNYENPRTIKDIEHFTVTVNRTNFSDTDNFDQFEGVIIQDDYAGFFDSSSNSGLPLYKWSWYSGDNQEPKIPGYSNPSHRYQSNGTYDGTVTVSVTGESIDKSRDFCVMVLSNMENNSGNIHVSYPNGIGSASNSVFWGNRSLVFSLGMPSIMNQLPSTYSNYQTVWDFGDNQTSDNKTVEHKYTKAGVYKVEFNGMNQVGPLTLLKTIWILGEPTLHVYPPYGPANTKITVNGSNYIPGTAYDVYFGNGLANKLDQNVVADPNGNFTTSFLVPSGFLSEPQLINVIDKNNTSIKDTYFNKTK